MMSFHCLTVLTFAAFVVAEYGGCRCAREAVVSSRSLSNCPRACFNDYVPVCGFNPCERESEGFRTFDNKCRQEATICNGPGYFYYYIYNGTCDARP